MNAPNNLSQFEDCSFTELAEMYRTLKRNGETVDVDALVKIAPHLESEIREQIPLIAMLDDAMRTDESSKPTASLIPNAIAGCVLNEEIGRGAMGVVFRAHQPELNRDVAIKVIQLNGDLNSQSDRLELERHALARLEHPNVIPAYSFTQDNQYAYLVMKLISGYGLNQLMNGEGDYKAQVQINQLKTDWIAFAQIAADAASGLQHAHENGLIHRDIKPANLLLDRDGKIWISDFGLAKMNDFAHAISRTGDVVGTPKYMAPEQIQGVCDPRSDIYSLGITLYELAAGQSARGKDWKSTQLLEGSLPQVQDIRELNSEVPEDLAHVIMKACRFLPDERYQSAEEFEIVLRRFLDGRVADRRKKKRKPDAIFQREFRRKAILSIVGSMLACAVVTYFLIRPAAQPEFTPETANNSNILDVLADTKKEKLDGHFADRLRNSIVKATNDLGLPEEETRELVSEINVVHAELKHGESSHKKIGEILDKYADSNLATATKIWRVNSLIKSSRMSSREKEKAIDVIHRFAYLAAKKRMPVADVARLKNSLTSGRSVTSEELYNLKLSTTQLRTWVAKVDKSTKHLIKPGEQIDVSAEIRQLFTSIEDERPVKKNSVWSNSSTRNHSNSSQRITIPEGITEADIESFKSSLSPEQIKQLEARINGRR